MQAESAGAEGKRQNLYYLPEVQERIHQKKLIWQGKGELGMFGYININQKIMTEENRRHIRHITADCARDSNPTVVQKDRCCSTMI